MAASPAIVDGSSPHDPIAASEPLAPTDHPKIDPASASIAYRYSSLVRASSRNPGRPSTEILAVASASVRLPSRATAKRETAPSAKLVVKTERPSLVATAQQISLRPFPIDAVTGRTAEPSSTYEEAAAFPCCAPKASVTTRMPSAVIVKPYGVGPDDAITVGAPSSPAFATGNATIAFVPRSVTMRVRPAGSNPTCAGSAPIAESGYSAS